ncbi:MAG: class 1 integron integrase IntI1 [Wenzhouxiangellaceae bacterium]
MNTESDLLLKMKSSLRHEQYSDNVEKAYLYWARAYLIFHNQRHPSELGRADLESFLSHLAIDRYAPASTQSQAMHALMYMYQQVLGVKPAWLERYVREREQGGMPNVLSASEVQRVLSHLYGQEWLISCLIYGAGLRLVEAARIRVCDLDFHHRAIRVRNSSGQVVRTSILPEVLIKPLQEHLEQRKITHIKDVAEGHGEVYLEPHLARTEAARARSWALQYVLTESRCKPDPRSAGKVRRHHIDERLIGQAIERAAVEASVFKRTSADTLRNCFAVHLIQQGTAMATVEKLVGHGQNSATDLSAQNDRYLETVSPLDRLSLN